MFDTEANKLRRMSDATIPRGRVAYRKYAHLGWHTIDILHAFGHGVIAENSS
jgi:hypothetical protein